EEFGEALAVPAEPAQRRAEIGADLEAADSLEDVRRPARFAVLAVVDDIEANIDLPPDDVLDGARGLRVDEMPVVASSLQLDERLRPHEAAGMSRQDAFLASLHGRSSRARR